MCVFLINKNCRCAGMLEYCVHYCYQVQHFAPKIKTNLKISTSSVKNSIIKGY